jgi:hypothetical protein
MEHREQIYFGSRRKTEGSIVQFFNRIMVVVGGWSPLRVSGTVLERRKRVRHTSATGTVL